MNGAHRTRGRNQWHSDGRPAGFGIKLEKDRPYHLVGKVGVAFCLLTIAYFVAQLLRAVI